MIGGIRRPLPLAAAATCALTTLATTVPGTMARAEPGFAVMPDRSVLDAGPLWLLLASALMLLAVGALLYARSRHQLAMQRGRNRSRTEFLLESLPIAIAYVDRHKRFRFSNRSFSTLYGVSPQELLGRTPVEALGEAAIFDGGRNIEAALTGREVHYETSTRLPTGNSPTREISLVPDLDEDGKARGVYILCTDVSERKQAQHRHRVSEQRLQAMLDYLPAGIFLKDHQARYLLVNRQFSEWFGVDPVDIVGKDVHDLYPPERAARYAIGDREILENWTVTSDEVEIPTAAGERRTFTLTKFPILDNGTGIGFGGVMIDVTERSQAEKTVRESERRAELANRAKSEFLANMSHELRTPLNAIIGFAEIVRSEMLGPVGIAKYVEYAGDIHDSADHLLGLINDILDLSKIESGADELHEEDVVIADVVEVVITLVKGRAHANDVALHTDMPAALPTLCADKRKLKQILVNLLTNAVKFTPASGAVTLRVRCGESEGFVFEVIDNGIGMASEDIPRALAPFGQVDSRLSRKYDGTGLGLPLAKQMIEMHGGELHVSSAVGVGTTVSVRFPHERTGWPQALLAQAAAARA